ncbi:MAG: transketolase [Polyangiaceae bacterium]|nr:transketolase [Polyangiaceae bacterium]
MNDLETAVRTVRFLSVDAVEQANSGHPGTPMALAGIGVELFTRVLRYAPERPDWPNRDRFVLSCGHASMLLYSLLHLAGYDVSLDDLKQFRQWGSKTPGHPEVGHTPGVETTTGPLGQGVGNAVGMALAGKLAAARLDGEGAPLIDYRVFVLCSDGDLMEGVASEAASLAGLWGLDNLIAIYDDNRITIDGSTELSFAEDVGKRFEAYGWSVQHVDGHDLDAVHAAIERTRGVVGRPSLIVARTHIGIGAPTKQDTAAAHGAPLGAAEVQGAKQAAGWPTEPTFFVPPEAKAPFARRVADNRAELAAWDARVSALTPERRAALDAVTTRSVPADLFATLRAALPGADATRSIASKLQQVAAARVPSLVGGSADLAESCKTTIAGSPHVARGAFAGRNLHFGIREHGMGAICNGLALSGFLPFASTFLIFSDYMRPSIRLAALMEQQVVYVFTHDSVLLGEDGPTHQPVEQIASLRLIPNLDVFRPADALECAAAWAHALLRRGGPTALVLTRQKVPELRREPDFDAERVLRGAYVLEDAADASVTLVATGSEVHVAVEAAAQLRASGQRVRVVSAPCLDAFERRPEAERRAVLGSAPVAALELGRTRGWEALVGDRGLVLGLDRFGASAPQSALAESFGFTPSAVAERVLSWLRGT